MIRDILLLRPYLSAYYEATRDIIIQQPEYQKFLLDNNNQQEQQQQEEKQIKEDEELDYTSGEKYGALISMIFYDDNSKYYSVLSGGPVSEYEKMEPIMFEILKSITLKQ